MKRNIEGYIKWLGDRRAREKRAMALVLAMSIAVSGSVCWLMRNTGTALADDAICGIEEHKHTEDCYEKVLICEEDHEHTDECYETKLVCGLEEHTHSELCYIDVSSHEKASDWEKTIPELTGVSSDDLMRVASSQMGYEEGKDGYTRYGDWYGNDDGDWNVMFVSFCLNYAGISSSKIPYGAGCWAWQVKLEESGLLVTDKSSELMPGDLLLVDNDSDGKCDRAGIVISVDGSSVSVVEGDVEGKVGVVSLQTDDSKLFGFVSVNSLDVTDVPEQETAETGEGQALEEQAEDAALVFEATTSSGIAVRAQALAGTFTDGVTMTAEDVNDKEIISQAEEAAGKNLGDKEEVKGTIAVDITFKDSEGNEVEPEEGNSVDVTITIPNSKKLEGDDYQLFHVNDSGVSEVKNATVTDNEAAFSSDGFSIFVVTATGERDKDAVHAYINTRYITVPGGVSPDDLNGDNIKNTADYPYFMRIGDTVTLVGHVDNSSYPTFSCNNSHVSVNNVTTSANEVTATVTALSATDWTYDDGWKRVPAVVRLDGTDEVFYIAVIGNTDREKTINLDDYSTNTMETVEVNYHDTIRIIGTDNGRGDTPYRPEDQNPGGEILTHIAYIHEGNISGRIFAANTYHADNNDEVVYMWTGNGLKRVRIVVKNDLPDALDHADIEIADGGKYTSVVVEGGGEDGMYKTVTEYQSHVYYVNSCNLYKEDNTPVFVFHREEDPDTWATTECVPLGQPHFTSNLPDDDYWHDENFQPGDSQYELTSKYHRIDVDENNWYFVFSKKRFFYQEVDSAEFDVRLQIVPTSVKRYKWNGTGWDHVGDDISYHIDFDHDIYTKTQGGVTETVDIDDIQRLIDSEIFKLDRTAVVDAYNKCPNHTGLDFTVHANTALLEFEANKKLVGRDLSSSEFTFGIYTDESCSGSPVATATNTADGVVKFKEINIDSDGNYTFYMKELDGNLEKVKYDQAIYRVEVKVTDMVADILSFQRKDDQGNWENATRFQFKNYYTFMLPETGGMGVIPFVAAGSAMIGGALILLMLRRRKEVDL